MQVTNRTAITINSDQPAVFDINVTDRISKKKRDIKIHNGIQYLQVNDVNITNGGSDGNGYYGDHSFTLNNAYVTIDDKKYTIPHIILGKPIHVDVLTIVNSGVFFNKVKLIGSEYEQPSFPVSDEQWICLETYCDSSDNADTYIKIGTFEQVYKIFEEDSSYNNDYAFKWGLFQTNSDMLSFKGFRDKRYYSEIVIKPLLKWIADNTIQISTSSC